MLISETVEVTQVWKALADDTRRSMLDLMSERRRTTGDLLEAFPRLSRTAVMKHLTVLVEANLVRVKREGRVRWNSMNAETLKAACEPWLNRHMQALENSALKIKQLAEARHRKNMSSKE